MVVAPASINMHALDCFCHLQASLTAQIDSGISLILSTQLSAHVELHMQSSATPYVRRDESFLATRFMAGGKVLVQMQPAETSSAC